MTDSSKSDDDWAELVRELERDTPPAATPPPAEEESEEGFTAGIPEHGAAGTYDLADGEAADEAAGEGEEGEPGADEQPGTGRKRRRRRRRRRKGAAGGATDATEAGDG